MATFAERVVDSQANLIRAAVSASRDGVQANDTRGSVVFKHAMRGIQIKTFDGDAGAFPGFWRAVNQRFEQSQYTELDKVEIVKALLEGNALRKIEAIDSTQPGAFEEVKSILERVYGNEEDQKMSALKRIYNLRVQNYLDVDALEAFSDELRTATTQLRQLGYAENQLDLLVHGVIDKFPAALKDVLLERRIQKGIENRANTLDDIENFLVCEIKHIRTKAEHGRSGGGRPVSASFMSGQGSGRGGREDGRQGCRYCDDDGHQANQCQQVVGYEARKRQAVNRMLCFVCLRTGHGARLCRSRSRCQVCNGRHHTSLHQDREKKAIPEKKEDAAESSSHISAVSKDGAAAPVHLATFAGLACNPHSQNKRRVNAFIDSGSSYTYVTYDVAADLRLRNEGTHNFFTSTFAAKEPTKVSAKVVKLELEGKTGNRIPIRALSVPYLGRALCLPASDLPADVLAKLNEKAPHGIANLPSSRHQRSFEADIIIGSDYAQLFIGAGVPSIALRPTLSAHLTEFGAIVTGTLGEGNGGGELDDFGSHSGFNCVNAFFNGTLGSEDSGIVYAHGGKRDLEALVERMTDLDVLGIAEGAHKPNFEDTLTKRLLATITRDEDGRFFVDLPFKAGAELLPSNFYQAFGRLKATHRRLSEEERKQYYAEFHKRIDEGVLEKVDGTQMEGPVVHTLSHFPVVKETSATTKIRPVVNASAAAGPGGLCLNDYLENGDNYLSELLSVQLRLRLFRHAWASDVKSAFYQIGIHPSHRDALRIILPKDEGKPVDQNNFQIWRFTRVVMGAKPSPWILHAVLLKLCLDAVDDTSLNLTKAEIEAVPKGLYVDNVIFGVDTEADGRRTVNGVAKLFESGKFHLREFVASEPSITADLAKEDKSSTSVVRNLGLIWQTETDKLSAPAVDFNDSGGNLTRHSLLSFVSRLYDAYGYLAPIILAGRLLYHKEFKGGDPWNKMACEETVKEWQEIKKEYEKASEISVPRLCVADRGQPADLILFSDGNLKAYGFSCYLHQNIDGQISCNFIFGRSRIVPQGKKRCVLVTVPRVELWGAVLATRAGKFVCASLDGIVKIRSIVHFIDSMTVLYWIRNGSALRPYESVRVREICEAKLTSDYRYVPSELNPADACTKPLTVNDLLSSHYLNGPPFLHLPSSAWPTWTTPQPDPELLLGTPPRPRMKGGGVVEGSGREMAGTEAMMLHAAASACANASSEDADGYGGMDCRRFSRLHTLLGATAYVRRMVMRLRSTAIPNKRERNESLMEWIRWVQKKMYPSELSELQKGKRNKMVRQLGLSVDEDGFLRVGGRFANADFDRDAKFPILLPSHHYITQLLILHIHATNVHSTPATTLSLIRQKFWIPRGLQTVRRVLRGCGACRLAAGRGPGRPRHGQLPSERLRLHGSPFTSMLGDQCGPFTTYNGGKATKRWVLVLTCAVTRAVHLELLYDYSADAVVHAFERFWSRRGLSSGTIWLDNATAFAGAVNTFGDKLVRSLSGFQAIHDLRFEPSPVRAPWAQGAVERMVGLVKQSLRPTLWRARLTDDDLVTVITRVESVINSRPLAALTTDPQDVNPLTPSHFLSPGGGPSLFDYGPSTLPPPTSSTACQLRRSYYQRMEVLHGFWKRFQKEYFSYLRSVHFREKSGTKGGMALYVGQPCLLVEASPRVEWKLCKVAILHPSGDGVLRYVTVTTANGHTARRSITHLVPLELEGERRMEGNGAEGAEDVGPGEEEGGAGEDDDEVGGKDAGEAGGLSARELRAQRRAQAKDALP